MDEYEDKYISAKELVNTMLEEAEKLPDDLPKGEGLAIATAAQYIRGYIKRVPVADVQPVKRWISVKDRLPEIGKSVLIYYPKWDGDEIQVAKLEGDEMMFDICGEFNIGTGAITHWMPLPEPPKDGDSNG